MRKKYILLLCVILAFLALTGCGDSGKSDEVSFMAIVLDNNRTHLLVEPEEGSSELKSANRIKVDVSDAVLFNSQGAEIVIDDIKTGDQIQVYYNGLIAESYPAQINGCHKVVVLEAVSDNDNFAKEITFENGFYRPDPDSLPNEIANWLSYSREIPCVQEKIYNGNRYVLITEGWKPSGGYGVEVKEVEKQPDTLLIKVKSTAPKEGEAVDTVLTSPLDLIIVEEKELPLSFKDIDDPERYFMQVLGLESIDRPIVASSDWIKIFSPKPDGEINGVIPLAGLACVFEGTVSYELLTEDNNVLNSGYTMAAMGDWGYFEEEIPVPADFNADRLVLQLYSESAKDGSKMFVVNIPLTLKK
ncbi:MAG: Gmad2 immunoglobulin-like domain-containing protein [Dethiobacteria bacterium]|jgi:hypothetical protein